MTDYFDKDAEEKRIDAGLLKLAEVIVDAGGTKEDFLEILKMLNVFVLNFTKKLKKINGVDINGNKRSHWI